MFLFFNGIYAIVGTEKNVIHIFPIRFWFYILVRWNRRTHTYT